eukprot:gene14249-15735_t
MASVVFTGKKFPNEEDVREARDILKPPGIMSKAYNKVQLKKVEREHDSTVKPMSQEALSKKYQTDYFSNTDVSRRINYFQATTKHELPSTYDRIKNMQAGYDPKLHRDDRTHAKSRGLKEMQLTVPSLNSSIYGHPNRGPLELQSRAHAHIEVCKKDFFRLTGTNIGKQE